MNVENLVYKLDSAVILLCAKIPMQTLEVAETTLSSHM